MPACCHIIIYTIYCRVQSRVCKVPFQKPSTAPLDEDRQDAFDELEDLLADGLPSSAVGWAVAQKALLLDRDATRDLRSHFRSHFQGRAVQNWTLLGLCLKQVSDVKSEIAKVHAFHTHAPTHRAHIFLHSAQLLLEAGFPELVDPAFSFIFQADRGIGAGQMSEASNDDAAVIRQTVQEIISATAEQPLSKVSVNRHEAWCMSVNIIFSFMYNNICIVL